jgi:hypothetical protein
MGFKKSFFLGLLVYIVSAWVMFILYVVVGQEQPISDVFSGDLIGILFGSMFLPSTAGPTLSLTLAYGIAPISLNNSAPILLILVFIIPNVLGAIVIGLLSSSPRKSILAVMLISIIGILVNLLLQFQGVPWLARSYLEMAITDINMQEVIPILLSVDEVINILVYGAISVLCTKYHLKH